MKKLKVRAVAWMLALLMLLSNVTPAMTAVAEETKESTPAVLTEEGTLTVTSELADETGTIIISDGEWDKLVITRDVAKRIVLNNVTVGELVAESGAEYALRINGGSIEKVSVTAPELEKIGYEEIVKLLADGVSATEVVDCYQKYLKDKEKLNGLQPTFITAGTAVVEALEVSGNVTLNLYGGNVSNVQVASNDSDTRLSVEIQNYDGKVMVVQTGNSDGSNNLLNIKLKNSNLEVFDVKGEEKTVCYVEGDNNSNVTAFNVSGAPAVTMNVDAETVTVDEMAEKSSLRIYSDVQNVEVSADNSQVSLAASAAVENAKVEGDNVKLSYTGTIGNAEITGNGSEVSYVPVATATPRPTATPTPMPTATPVPTVTPEPTLTVAPAEPTVVPSEKPAEPTVTPFPEKEGVEYEYYENGKLKKETVYNTDGKITSVSEFDENAKLSTKMMYYYSDGNVTHSVKREYDAQGREIMWARYEADGTLDYTRRTEYYGDTKVMKQQTQYDNAGKVTYIGEYDEAGKLSCGTNYDAVSGEKKSYTLYEYDNLGKQIMSTTYNPEGIVTGFSKSEYYENGITKCVTHYDAKGNPIMAMTFDENGNLYSNYSYTYDAEKKLISSTEYSFKTGKQISQTNYHYNDEGTLSDITKMLFDENGRVSVEQVYDADGILHSYYENEYNEIGQLIKVIGRWADGVFRMQVDYEYYENGNRKQSVQYNEKMAKTYVTQYAENGVRALKMQYVYENDSLIYYIVNEYDETGLNVVSQTKYDKDGNEFPTATPEPTATPVPTATPKPTATPTPEIKYAPEYYFLYDETSSGVIITGLNLYNEETWEEYDFGETLYIPPTINGKQVVEIAGSSLCILYATREVVIPEGVTKIGSYAFAGSSVEVVSLPASVTDLREYDEIETFVDANNLQEIIVDSSNKVFTSLDGNLYSKDMTKLLCIPAGKEIDVLEFPATVTSVETYALYGVGIGTIVLSENIQDFSEGCYLYCDYVGDIVVENSAYFKDCGDYILTAGNERVLFVRSGVSEFTIPKEMKQFNMNVFEYNDNVPLSKINVEEGNAYFCMENGVLYTKRKNQLIHYTRQAGEIYRDTEYRIPSTVTVIGSYAFYDSCLSYIDIPSSVEIIDIGAFKNCTNLKKLNLPSAMTIVTPFMCYGCQSLVEISVPYGVTIIGTNSFANCGNLQYIEIPNSVRGISMFMERYSSTIIITSNEQVIRRAEMFGWTVQQ